MFNVFKEKQWAQRGQTRASRVSGEVEKRWEPDGSPVIRHSEDAGILSQ